ncbi:MAG TPA: hypothetical protein VFZ97_07870 [Acidimicrobiales bacterium]
MDASTPVSEQRRHPSKLELAAGALLLAAVILHVAAMFPDYFSGGSPASIASQADQAALYAVVAAAWATALGFGLAGPRWVRIAAAFAVGAALGELGFRVSDLGQVFRYGTGQAGPGLWIMTAAWVVGAAGAATAVLAVRSNRQPALDDPPASGFNRWATLAGVGALSTATAGFFLPAWDHYTGVSAVTGRAVSFNLGNAFAEPWQIVIGNVLSALAIAAIPILAALFMWKDRRAAVAATGAVLTMLGAQFASAVIQVDQAVPPSIAGLSGPQARQLGFTLSMKLTGWFALDTVLALAVLVTTVVVAAAKTSADENLTTLSRGAVDAPRPAYPVW